MNKKILAPFLVAILSFLTIFLSFTPAVYADSTVLDGRTGSECGNFLGFTSWDCNVTIHKDQESLKTGIWVIAANILTDIIVASAYLVLGFVIYGGYLYTMSSGDPGKIASGKKTLSNAFIGLAIVLLSYLILNSIRIALGGANLGEDCVRNQCVDPSTMITGAIQWAVGMVGIVSAIFVVYGGISYTISAGDPGKLKKAKDTILYALIGLIIVALAEIITAFVSSNINKAKPNTSINNHSIAIIKEVHEINHN